MLSFKHKFKTFSVSPCRKQVWLYLADITGIQSCSFSSHSKCMKIYHKTNYVHDATEPIEFLNLVLRLSLRCLQSHVKGSFTSTLNRRKGCFDWFSVGFGRVYSNFWRAVYNHKHSVFSYKYLIAKCMLLLNEQAFWCRYQSHSSAVTESKVELVRVVSHCTLENIGDWLKMR